jgi:hypothetical protein
VIKEPVDVERDCGRCRRHVAAIPVLMDIYNQDCAW